MDMRQRTSGSARKNAAGGRQTALDHRFADSFNNRFTASGTPFELCTWDELRKLAADPLVTIGGHTCTHPILAQVSKHVAQAEITEGRAILQNNLQLPVNFFCYPNGRTTDFTAEHVKLVQDAGFDCAVTTVEDLCAKGSDPYRLRRKNVSGQFTTAALDCKLAGLWWKAG